MWVNVVPILCDSRCSNNLLCYRSMSLRTNPQDFVSLTLKVWVWRCRCSGWPVLSFVWKATYNFQSIVLVSHFHWWQWGIKWQHNLIRCSVDRRAAVAIQLFIPHFDKATITTITLLTFNNSSYDGLTAGQWLTLMGHVVSECLLKCSSQSQWYTSIYLRIWT